MTSKLFVGGLPFHYTNAELKGLFAPAGTVVSAEMVFDPDRARTRGFGFVEMGSPDQAQEAIASLNGQKVGEKQIYVTVAREKTARPSLGNLRFPKIPNRKVGRDDKSTYRAPSRAPGNSTRPDRPAWPPPRGDRRNAPGSPSSPQFPDSNRSFGARPGWQAPRGERPFDKPPRRYKGSKPFDRSAPGFPPSTGGSFGGPKRTGFSGPNKWEPRGDGSRPSKFPRRDHGDFGSKRPTGKPAKKPFWQKFDKKRPSRPPND